MGYRNLLRCIGQVRPEALVAIPKAHLFSRLFPLPFASARIRCAPGLCPIPGTVRLRAETTEAPPKVLTTEPEDPAAIIFTTGSTGPPKGVRYSHGIFAAQLRQIGETYGIGHHDTDQPGFPLFALFSNALGATVVIPRMDPTRPAKVDPRDFTSSILRHGVTTSFGSPAIWNAVSRYCAPRGLRLPSLRTVLMAGAPVSGDLIARTRSILPPEANIFTPYGATEALPVTSIESREILSETWEATKHGNGVCVGRPLPGIEVRVIDCADGPIAAMEQARILPAGEIGEIVVRGDVVTRAYEGNDTETALAKIADTDGFWHRMGDLGFLDEQGRLWFCGRKAHRVRTDRGVMDTIRCEAIINTHPAVFRSALVGIGPRGRQTPVLVVEPAGTLGDPERLIDEIRTLAARHDLTRPIRHVLVHDSFPVDIRHNAKIFRERLAVWAETRLMKTENKR